MTRILTVIARSIAAVGCRVSAPPTEGSPDAPPPLVEPELPPGSRLVEPRADALARAMSHRLATDINSASASVGDRFQGFLDIDVAADGRHIGRRPCPGGQDAADPCPGQDVVIRAQFPQAFTLAVPLQVDLMTNVAVR
jgi:hypothetical protein